VAQRSGGAHCLAFSPSAATSCAADCPRHLAVGFEGGEALSVLSTARSPFQVRGTLTALQHTHALSALSLPVVPVGRRGIGQAHAAGHPPGVACGTLTALSHTHGPTWCRCCMRHSGCTVTHSRHNAMHVLQCGGVAVRLSECTVTLTAGHAQGTPRAEQERERIVRLLALQVRGTAGAAGERHCWRCR
jgi:hypothetical protein